MRNDNRENPSLGRVLREAREQQGMSIRQAAAKAGVHFSFLARLESGETLQPAPEIVQRLADMLGLDINEVLPAVGIKPSLPEPRMYFRKKLGVSASEADILARLVEDYQAKQVATKQPKRKPKGAKADEGD